MQDAHLVPSYSKVVETANVGGNEDKETDTTICRLPDGTFSVAKNPQKEVLLESSETDEVANNEDEEYERLMLYILMSNPPSGPSVLATRWKYNVLASLLFIIDTVALFIVGFASLLLLDCWVIIAGIVVFLVLADVVGAISMHFSSIRGMTLFIVVMFNRTILSLLFLPTAWFSIIIPTGFALLLIAYLLRNTFYSPWFPAVA